MRLSDQSFARAIAIAHRSTTRCDFQRHRDFIRPATDLLYITAGHAGAWRTPGLMKLLSKSVRRR